MILHGLLLDDPNEPPPLGWLRVDETTGRIVEQQLGEPPRVAEEAPIGGRDAVVCPGFVDAHTHPPQFDVVGVDGLPLLQWLDRVVYPAEIWWGRTGGVRLAERALDRLLHEGTLGVAGWLTSHAQAAWEVAQLAARGVRGNPPLRTILGRVAMDREAPEELVREDRLRAAQTPAPSPALPALPASSRCQVSVNPRFVVACTAELLAEIGWLLRDRPELVIQTHLAESPDELARTRELFPDAPHATAILDEHGLLGPRTLLAHCVHLTDEQWRLIAQRRCVVVHCPQANLFLRSGLFNFDKAREHGVRLALGSDLGAGVDLAMPRVARAMIETAKVRQLTVDPRATVPSAAEAWRLITRDGALALGWEDAGSLKAGAAADLLVLKPPQTWLDEHLVARLLYNWSPTLIAAHIVAGRLAASPTI